MQALTIPQASSISALVRATVLFTRAKALYLETSGDANTEHLRDRKVRSAKAFKDITVLLIDLQFETGIEYEPNIKEWLGRCDVTIHAAYKLST